MAGGAVRRIGGSAARGLGFSINATPDVRASGLRERNRWDGYNGGKRCKKSGDVAHMPSFRGVFHADGDLKAINSAGKAPPPIASTICCRPLSMKVIGAPVCPAGM